MPIPNLIRIMRSILPPHARIDDDAKETIQECVSEFISVITSEANEKCHQEYRKTITAEDLLSSLSTLGFDSYIEPLSIFLSKYRAQDPKGSSMRHMPFLRRGVSFVEQQLAPQMALPPLPPPPPPPTLTLTMVYNLAVPPTYGVGDNNYIELPQMNIDYFTGNQGGGEDSSSGLSNSHSFR